MYDDIPNGKLGIWDKAIAIFVICDHLHVWSFQNTPRSFKPVVTKLITTFFFVFVIYLFIFKLTQGT